jgi:hypothetical protein
VSISMIVSMDMVYINGRMVISILGIGQMERDKEEGDMY